MHTIIGLGNPGEKYKNTRHNTGFMAIDFLVAKLGLTWSFNKKFNAQIATPPLLACPPNRREKERDGVRSKTLFVKPQTFMNNSGQAVQAILSYYKLLPRFSFLSSLRRGRPRGGLDLSETLTIIHDDIDIELGKYKISVNSRSAGHKGVGSIINHLKTKNFKRIRIGIRLASPKSNEGGTEATKKIPPEKFVLQKFSDEELKIVNNLIKEISI